MSTRTPIRAFAVVIVLALAFSGISSALARGGGGAAATVSGTVYTIDTANKKLTIKTDTGASVRLGVGRSASITRNGAAASLKSLALNDSVSAQYKVATLAARTIVATGPAVSTTSGTAKSVSIGAGTLTVGAQVLQTNAGTRIARNGQIVALKQITLKDTLVAHVAMGTNVALDVVGDGPAESEVHGVISGIAGSDITITPGDGSPDVTVVVGTMTIIEVNDASGTLADLQLGEAVEAEYDPTTFAAFSIDVNSEDQNAEVEGTVSGVDPVAGTVTITPQDGAPDITLSVDASTEIDVNDEGAGLADIQVGMPIKAEYDASSLLASEIEAGGSGD